MAIKINVLDEIRSVNKTNQGAGQNKGDSKKGTIAISYPAELDGTNNASNPNYKSFLIFTAYDFDKRDSGSLRTFRQVQLAEQDKNAKPALNTSVIANLQLPMSKSDVDSTNHKFNDVGDSLITRGGGTATGVLSNVASTAVFSMVESLTQGVMADNNEQMYTASRSLYGGAEHRTKVFTWDITPRSQKDLEHIIAIYETMQLLSYGRVGQSQYTENTKKILESGYKDMLKNVTPDGADLSNTLFSKGADFLKNVIVVSNPTVWFVRAITTLPSNNKFNKDVFGPCQIQSIRFDKTPNGQFNGLEDAPAMSSSFVLEITMREILALNRESIQYGGA
ncbi:baseplate tail tube cap [Shewanella phage Thanatos-2]|nr:baseplate tail tube cap [Shewanella phage Thanatos-2]